MSDLNELYQELIIDHSRSPRHFGKLDAADYKHEGYNPLCGDRVTVYLKACGDKIQDAKFEGCGCAISTASASLMTEVLIGKTKAEIEAIFRDFHHLVTKGALPAAEANARLEKLVALAGVSEYPMRVKCATLPWHTTLAALKGEKND